MQSAETTVRFDSRIDLYRRSLRFDVPVVVLLSTRFFGSVSTFFEGVENSVETLDGLVLLSVDGRTM